jgi:hypothetical protein
LDNPVGRVFDDQDGDVDTGGEPGVLERWPLASVAHIRYSSEKRRNAPSGHSANSDRYGFP